MRNVLKALGIIAITAVIGFSMITCGTGDTDGDDGDKPGSNSGNNTGSNTGSNEPKRYVLDISETTDWDYMVVGDDGSILVFSVNKTTNIPTRAYLKPKKDSDDGITYLFKEDGLPGMMIYNGYIVYFSNYDQYKFDMGIIKPDDNPVRSNTVRSIRGRSIGDDYYDDDDDDDDDTLCYFGLECDIDIDAFKVQMAKAKDTLWNVANAELDVFGKILGSISCIAAIGFPPGYIGCGIFVLSTITGEVVDMAFEGTANKVLQTVLSALNCATGDVVDCTSTAVGVIELLTRKDIETISKNPEKVGEVIKRIEKEQYVPVTGVTIVSSASVAAGGTKQLVATITPYNATYKTITWTTSNPNIATVGDYSGLVKGVAEGTAVITATTSDGKKKATCTVTVTSTIHVTGVTLDKTSLELVVGHYYEDQLTATTLPSNATIKDITWTSSNVNVATVTGRVSSWLCNIETVAPGTTTITASTVDGNKTASCVVTVLAVAPGSAVTGITLNKTTLSLGGSGASETLIATVLPSTAKDPYFEWSSSNENIATVRRAAIGPDGIVTAMAEGTATITATTRDGGYTATCTVTVSATGTPGLAYQMIDASGNAVTSGGVAYRVKRGTVTSGEVYIPATYNGLPVTAIGHPNDTDNTDNPYVVLISPFCKTSITAVHFIEPSNITYIGPYAFSECENLTMTELPAKVTSIGKSAFYGCKKLALTSLPAGITSISESAFDGCTKLALTSLPAGITSIGSNAFFGCTGLTQIDLPAGITSIGSFAFGYCKNLALTSLPAGITSIGRCAFSDCTNLALTSLPAGVKTIGDTAFRFCSNITLTELPAGITSISEYAFDGCTKLALTSLPAGLTSISDSAFYNCKKLALTSLPAGVKTIGSGAFYGCTGLTQIDLPAGLTSIGGSAFNGCTGLTQIDLPAGLTSIDGAFSGCTGLTQINLPAGLTSIGASAFYGCTGLTQIDLPAGVTSIGNYAFSDCKGLTQIDLPAGVTSIGNSAFMRCTGLTKIDLPAGLTSIGNSVFFSCTNLDIVTCRATTPPTLGTTVFGGNTNYPQPKLSAIKVPSASVEAYKAATNWSTYAGNIIAE